MIVREKTSLDSYGQFVKVAVDIEKRVMAIGCDLHIDCLEELLESGSLQKNIWGASVYPAEKRIDFVSLINIRPAEGNRSMEIVLPEVKKKVESVINELVF